MIAREEHFYYWLIVSINPYEEGLDLNKVLVPKDISARLALYTDNEKIHFFPNAALNTLFAEIVGGGRVKPYETKKGRTLSCVEDIKFLWEDAGIKISDVSNMSTPELFFNVLNRLMAIKAYFTPETLKRLAQAGAGGGDKQSGQLAITQKEKTEHPLIIEYNKALEILSSYYDALCDLSVIKSVKNDQERVKKVKAWCKEYEPLDGKAVRIYESLRPNLGLPYDPRELIWWNMDVDLLKNLGKLQEVIQRVKELKERTQWELKKEALITQGGKTSGVEREGKPVLTHEKKKGKVKEFFKKHRRWLIPAIASIISGIIGPVIAWIVIRKLGG